VREDGATVSRRDLLSLIEAVSGSAVSRDDLARIRLQLRMRPRWGCAIRRAAFTPANVNEIPTADGPACPAFLLIAQFLCGTGTKTRQIVLAAKSVTHCHESIDGVAANLSNGSREIK
jgi:hypothetical protein